MKNKIWLNEDVSIDTPKLLESRAVILANSGGGKSYIIRKIAEEAVSQVQTIIIDPEGEFASLREKYDFILAGKNADVPVEVRSAALLATKLLELRKSAVIDLYELHPSERQRYVKLFFEAMVNCPKELYHPAIVLLDEAHEYAPEGKPSEATWAVEALAAKGRKRGFCLIPASQRMAKLSKNLSAECNNKLIGRASQDIDMKRAGDELGFSKEKLVQLRQLKPGEFFAFGPAISDEVIKVKIGDVKTSHAKVGYKKSKRLPPPSHVIKKVLGELADLPQEAEQEAKTTAEFKAQITLLKRELTTEKQRKVDLGKEIIDLDAINKAVSVAVKNRDIEWAKVVKEWQKYAGTMVGYLNLIQDPMDNFSKNRNIWKPATEPQNNNKVNVYKPDYKKIVEGFEKAGKKLADKDAAAQLDAGLKTHYTNTDSPEKKLGSGEMAVLTSLGQYLDGLERENITVITGYKRSSRDAYIYRLKQKELIEEVGNKFKINQKGIDYLGNDYKPLPVGQELRDHLMQTLPEGERKTLAYLMERHPDFVSRDELTANIPNMARSSRDAYLYRLANRQLIELQGRGMVKASDKLYE